MELASSLNMSVVTISFNCGDYLRNCVESVLDTKVSGLEYIVWDNCSTDASTAFLHSLSDARLKFISRPDLGPADALNSAFQLVSGDIFGYLNCDDIYLPGTVDKVLDFFTRNEAVDVLVGSGYVIDAKGRRQAMFIPRKISTPLLTFDATAIFQPAIFYRRSILPETPFNSSNRTCWDAELLLNLSRQSDVTFARDPTFLAAFRIHPTSISGSGRLSEMYENDRRAFVTSRHNENSLLFQLTKRILRLYSWLESRLWRILQTIPRQHPSQT